jgi:hypothetical protein
MRIVFDQGTPAPLRKLLSEHDVDLAFELGWSTLRNGELLRMADAAGYAALVTTDKNFRFQQNLANYRLAVVVLPTTSWPKIKSKAEIIASALDNLSPGEIVDLKFD